MNMKKSCHKSTIRKNNFIKRILPWLIAIAVFAYLFHAYPPRKVWDAIKYVNIPAFFGFSILYFLFLYILDSWSIKHVLCRFSHSVSLRSVLTARGVTYLIMILNYPASQAAFAYYLKKRHNVPIFDALGLFAFIVFIDMMWLLTFSFAGTFLQECQFANLNLSSPIRIMAIVAYIIAFLWLAFWRRLPDKLFGRKISIPILERIRKRRIFHVFEKAGIIDYIKISIMRCPIYIALTSFMYVVIMAFHAHIDLLHIIANVPIIFLIGSLPLTPGGIGTTNVATVELLHPYVTGAVVSSGGISPKELLFAMTLLWMFANYLWKAVLGAIFLKSLSKEQLSPNAIAEKMSNANKDGADIKQTRS